MTKKTRFFEYWWSRTGDVRTFCLVLAALCLGYKAGGLDTGGEWVAGVVLSCAIFGLSALLSWTKYRTER